MSTFDESLHPRTRAGKFTDKVNDAPMGTLTAQAAGASLDRILAERGRAAALHAAARDTYLRANSDAAIATLREQFPGGQLAIFTQDAYENRITLRQVLGEKDVEFEEDWDALTPEQRRARSDAQAWVQEMGDDVTTYLDSGEEEHDDWYEYQLDLTAQPTVEGSAAERLLDSLIPADRSALDAALSERDGRMISTVDTDEIAYQLQDGVVGEGDPETADRLEAQFGSLDSAARNIAETRAWGALREEVDTYVRGRLFDTIAAAADELNRETL